MTEMALKRMGSLTSVTFCGLVTAAGVAVVGGTVAGLLGRFWWLFDLFSHFQIQYLISMSVIVAVLAVTRRFKTAVLLASCGLLNLAHVLPYYVPIRPAREHNSTRLRLVTSNVNTANQQYDLVKQLILDQQPDVVLLTEVSPIWLKSIREVEALYPFRKSDAREDNFGIALYSKRPFKSADIVYVGGGGVPSVVAVLDVSGRELTVVGTHPLPPINGFYSAARNGQIDALAPLVASLSGPKVLLGDLNVSPWSYHFKRLVSRTALRDGALGHGLHLTWPSKPMFMRIPIDFCLVSRDIEVESVRVGPAVGSDHYPLIADVFVP
jgi:endonuclease/exonuclease/phosphatase (EEP) superfamily protein YafD